MQDKKELINILSKTKSYNPSLIISNNRVSQPANIFYPLRNGKEYLPSNRANSYDIIPQKMTITKIYEKLAKKSPIQEKGIDYTQRNIEYSENL